MLFDSHCHLDHPTLLSRLPALLTRAQAAGVTGFLIPGVEPAGWSRIAELAGTDATLFPAFGLHPMHAHLLTPEVIYRLRTLSRSAVAIGEIGLDYGLATPGRDLQKYAFRTQLDLAAEAGLPVLIHCRKAFGDLLAILR